MLDRLQSFSVDRPPRTDPRVVHLASDAATSVIGAISSETARDIMAALHEDPRPPSRLAAAVGTSIANVNYHLEKLQRVGLVTDVDTWYSEKGREMTVYAPADDPLVFAGTEDRASRVRSLLAQVGAAVVLLAASSALVQWLVSRVLVSPSRTETLRKATSAGTIESVNLTPIPPGVLFFTGGTFVLAVLVTVRYLTAGRP